LSDSTRLIRDQMKVCHQGLVDLEVCAGIAEAAETLRTEVPFYPGLGVAGESYSRYELRELDEAEEKRHQHRITRRIRDLYFAVRDAELRKELIKKDREEGSFVLRYWQQ